ncbi:adhesion G protein-coupled receptor L3-like isoform X4 [Mytilus galloprovincialis]|uniref:adhesion G protein-coupled receptor L3-like isoform X4 n=1 Tax=Mytilus galloprovincialis TaxID=29158 RepID=UPI003F7C9B44
MLLYLFCTCLLVYCDAACDKDFGPEGLSECVLIPPQYKSYQWATCLSNYFIKMASNGKHYCLDDNTYCLYQCMIEFYNVNDGEVYQNCSCLGYDSIPKYSNVSLPDLCYVPTGFDCNWYNDCFRKKYSCSGIDDGGITFQREFCSLYDQHQHKFKPINQILLANIRRCLQVDMVRIVRPWVQVECSEIKNLSISVNKQCFTSQEFQNVTLSLCDMNADNFWSLVVTLVESLHKQNGSSDGISNLLEAKSFCSNKDIIMQTINTTVVRIETNIETRHTFYNNAFRSTKTITNIVTKLAELMLWRQHGLSWHAWVDTRFQNISPDKNSIFILLASRQSYDMNYNDHSRSPRVYDAVDNLASGISEGMFVSVNKQIVTIQSLEACVDLLCQHIYLSTDLTETRDYCPVEQFESINWWKTAAGETDIKECPPNYTGNASRQCDSNGNWGTPVYIYCVNEILHKTTEKLKKLEQITNPEQAAAAISDILDTVDNTTGDHNEKPLKSGDLKQTTSILSSIIQIGNSKNASVNSEKFADVLNSVLNTENSHSWNEVNTHDDSEKGASSIMRIVDSLGSLVQKNLSSNETKIINRKNLVIEISTLKKNLSFPSDVHSRSKLLLADQPALKDKFYTAAMYKTLSGILPTTVNRSVGSDVMSVSFDKAIHNLAENISITFERNKKVKFIDPKISCGYWNFSSRIWTYDGCYLKMSDSKVSTCTCNHLTNFAILMSPSDVEISDASKKALEIITFVGCGLSILGCFLTLIIYAVFWRFVKHEWAVILMHMCIVLIIGYSVFLSATEETENDVACIIITGVLHYVFLVVFFLMLCNGISVARSVIYVFKTKSRLPIYIAVAWVVPLLIVGITLGITRLKGYHSEKYCWLNTSNFVFMSFVGPALLIILMNIGTIIIVLRAVYSRKGIQNETLKKKARDGIKCMVTLLPVLGLSWLFGILAFNEDTIIFQYLFGITTSCQGLFIFIFHTVLSKKVQEGFRQTMHRRRAKSMSNFSSKPKSSGTHDRFDSKGKPGRQVYYTQDKTMMTQSRKQSSF